MDFGFGPEEGRCGQIVLNESAMCATSSLTLAKEAPLSGLRGQDREPDFDLTEPGSVSRRVVEMNVLMAIEPHVAVGLVGREIVEDDMDFALRIPFRRRSGRAAEHAANRPRRRAVRRHQAG